MDKALYQLYDIGVPLVRIGPKNDGGYVLADGLVYDLILSGGIATNISFENALCEQHPNIVCHAFDHSIERLPLKHHVSNLVWHKIAVGDVEEPGVSSDLKSLIEPHQNIMLKMDIEGWEIPWFSCLDESHMRKFAQIALETHDLSTKTQDMLRKILVTHTCVHVHANNHGYTKIIGDTRYARILEWTFVRNDLCLKKEKYEGPLPRTLDAPNCRFRTDIPVFLPADMPFTDGRAERRAEMAARKLKP